LTVNDGRTRLFLSPLLGAHSHAQGLQETIPDPFPLPPAKVVIDGLPPGKLMGQQAPGTPTAQDVQNRIDDLASRDKRPAALQGWLRDQRFQQLPLRIRETRRDRLSSPVSFSYVFCSFSLLLRLVASSPFFFLSARRRLSNTI
jgi:hypothetical protein